MGDILLFDVDGTLFDADLFGALIRKNFIDIIGIDEGELIRANADYYADLPDSTDFNARNITQFIAQRFQVDVALLDKIFWETDNLYRESIYSEAGEVLAKLSESKALGIFSQGFEELQRRKVEASGLSKYFTEEYMFFHKRKTTEEAIVQLPHEATVIDDNHDVVQKIAPHVTAIWINRRTEDRDPVIKTIHNLTELLD